KAEPPLPKSTSSGLNSPPEFAVSPQSAPKSNGSSSGVVILGLSTIVKLQNHEIRTSIAVPLSTITVVGRRPHPSIRMTPALETASPPADNNCSVVSRSGLDEIVEPPSVTTVVEPLLDNASPNP